MSGLIALLDDVVALTKLAAASVDDVAGMAAKAGTKTAGVVIDDAAVTPKYVTGLSPKRELPIIWKIARAYLCFEGAEKVWHVLAPHKNAHVNKGEVSDPAHLEETRVRGAIKTDFILSAEILTITLNEITKNFPDASIVMQGAVLALIAVVVTAVVYGSVALIVKADDTGLWLAKNAPTPVGRTLGRGLVKGMPYFLVILSFVGTLAMLWVGGSILVNELHHLGFDAPYDFVKGVAAGFTGLIAWAITAGLDGIFGLIVGLAIIPVVTKVILPLTGSKNAH